MIRVGILGMGFMGQTHLDSYRQLPEVKVVGVAGSQLEKIERFARKNEIRAWSDPMSLVRSGEVDVVDICVPTYLHETYALAAAQAGKHIFCEKPLALNAGSARQSEAHGWPGVTLLAGV